MVNNSGVSLGNAVLAETVSDENEFITGTILTIDGGYSAR